MKARTNLSPAQLRRRKRCREILRQIVGYVLLSIGAVAFAFPFFWMLMSSFKPEAEIFTYPIKWLPSRFRWENYVEIFRLVPFKQYYINTIVITSLSVVGTLISCSLAAYGFARMEFLGKNALFILTLSVMMLPVHVTVIPLFVMFRRLGWIDTFYPLIVPHFFGTAYYIFLLRQFFATLPKVESV